MHKNDNLFRGYLLNNVDAINKHPTNTTIAYPHWITTSFHSLDII